jgi:hypothetical protein
MRRVPSTAAAVFRPMFCIMTGSITRPPSARLRGALAEGRELSCGRWDRIPGPIAG